MAANELRRQTARVEQILGAIDAGLSRDEVAQTLLLQDHKSVDQYMRRHGYGWDPVSKRYRTKPPPIPFRTDPERYRKPDLRVRAVIDAFTSNPNEAPKEIAKRLGFDSAVQMAKYMQARGYVWSSEAGNYLKSNTSSIDDEPPANVVAEFTEDSAEMAAANLMPGVVLQRYLPILVWLDKHRDQIETLVQTEPGGRTQLPRYAVPGRLETKSVYMASSVAQLVQDFSREKNIRQRDVFEVALIEFFRKYGYAREVEAALSL